MVECIGIGAQATDTYTLHGAGVEGYMPTQTYHGELSLLYVNHSLDVIADIELK